MKLPPLPLFKVPVFSWRPGKPNEMEWNIILALPDESDQPYIVEELNEDGSVKRILAVAENETMARAAFATACERPPTRKIILRLQAKVIVKRG